MGLGFRGFSGDQDALDYLLHMWLNFKLFGCPYLVGVLKFNVFLPLVIGEVRLGGLFGFRVQGSGLGWRAPDAAPRKE